MGDLSALGVVQRPYLGSRSPLQLCLNRPGKCWPPVHLQYFICDYRVLVFGVNQQAIHVEETRPDWRETVHCHVRVGICKIQCISMKTYSLFEGAMSSIYSLASSTRGSSYRLESRDLRLLDSHSNSFLLSCVSSRAK